MGPPLSTDNKPQDVYLIDASIYIFRYYFSLPDNWWSKSEYPTAAVYGYVHWLIRFLKSTKATHVAACFDESLESCFRNEIYADYKCSRVLPDEDLAFQLEACKQITELLGIPAYASTTHEADDLIGTLAKRCRKNKLKVNILSRDKDLSQLVVGDLDVIWDFPDGEPLGKEGIFKKLGVFPHQVADYLALVGDSSDDIPGVPGVGKKTAAALFALSGSWSNLQQDFSAVAALPLRGAVSLAGKLKEFEEQISMALQLSKIVDNAPLNRRFSVKRKKLDLAACVAYGRELGFGRNFETSMNKLVEVL